MKKMYPTSGKLRQCKNMYPIVALLLGCILLQQKSIAQAPNLPTKGALSQTLLTNRIVTNSTAIDTVIKPFFGTGAYTLEVVGKVTSATGRGLDIEARNGALNGFRVSLDAASLKSTSPLASATTLTASAAAQNQIIRIAVKNDSAHIYQNSTYIQSQPLAAIKDIAAGVETDVLNNATTGPALIPGWAGTAGNNAGKPSDYGWLLNPASTTLFATANSTTAGTSRYMDVNASSGSNLHTYDNATYTGRLLYVRWDGASTNTMYAYPVTLEADAIYDFSLLYAYISNGTPGSSISVGIGATTTIGGRISSKTLATSNTIRALKKGDFVFSVPTSGTYYITIYGPTALYSVGELSVNKLTATPRFIFGKNYPTGAVDMEIVSATYEDGAWAPGAVVAQPRQTVTLTGTSVQVPTTFNTDFVVPGKTDVHFTAENSPYGNSSIALNSNDSWLFFDNIRPALVLSNWLSTITINGSPAVNNSNFRLSVYKNGTVIIPNGNLTNNAALQVFTQPNGIGTAQTYSINTVNNNLGTLNNAIRSFKLKRGYAATFANNTDGTGYSRVFVANDSDITVNTMPQGLDTTISFLRVVKWNWPSKKGKAGWSPDKIGATWYYDWNIAGDASNANYEYQSIRQTQYWPGFGDIINKGVSQILGFNEPDRPDQANMTIDQCVAAWPGLMQTGLRVGSPAPSNPESSYITDFLRKTDSLNYRVDFVAIHCYWGGATPQQWYSRLLNIYNRVKRPLWITEWNNGANWTTETWPADVPSQLQKQLNDMKGILQVLDTASFIERYAEYDWVENKRALVLADTLTPAGKYYFANKSDLSYNSSKAFVHNWRLVTPRLASNIVDTNYYKTNISWSDLNGELGSKYILERKIDGRDTGFLPVQTFAGYAANATFNYADSVYGKATYRLRVYGADTSVNAYSFTLDVVRDATPVAPGGLAGTIISSSRAQLSWNTATTARSYNLKRSLSATGPWTTIASRTTALTYLDSTLSPATTYYYVATTLNSAGESANSAVLMLTTPALVIPATVLNPRIAAGDTKVTITWDFQYDARYKVLRSATSNGVFDTVAVNVNALRYVDYNRANNTSYYYKLVAYNAVGASPVSAMLTATPQKGQHLFVNFDDTTSAVAQDIWGGFHADMQATATRDTGYNATSRALKLDGSATAYAALAERAIDSLNNFTISTWVKMTALTNWMRIFDFGTGTNKYMFLTPQVSATGGVSNMRYVIKNGGTEQVLNYNYTWNVNTWTHLAVTQQNDTVKLYVNGVLVASTGGITIKPADLGITNQNYIGKSQFSADPMLRGFVDEFKIYNYALSDQNIANLYNGTPLPISLLTLVGKATAQGNLLTWKVSSTADNIRMELEKSNDGRAFSRIYSVAATRNTIASPFTYTDILATGAIQYYRLKMIDVDGKVTYSPVVAITSNTKGTQLVGMYPTLVSSTAFVSINAEKAASVNLVIIDIYGRAVQSSSRSILAGANLLNVDATTLATGTYTLTVYNADARIGNIRFVVNR